MIILEQKMIQRIQQLGHNFVVIKNLLCSSSCDFIDIQSRKISISSLHLTCSKSTVRQLAVCNYCRSAGSTADCSRLTPRLECLITWPTVATLHTVIHSILNLDSPWHLNIKYPINQNLWSINFWVDCKVEFQYLHAFRCTLIKVSSCHCHNPEYSII